MINFKLLSLFLFICLSNSQITFSQTKNFKLVDFKTEDNGKIEAVLFSAKSDKIIIYAHGAIYNKESWYFLAQKFQKLNVNSLVLDFRGYGKSKSGKTNKKLYDIIGAINYAKNNGFSDINIIGASMGGEAVLSALVKNKISIAKVVLMAPAGGPPISSNTMDKLFIVSKKEGLHQSVIKTYKASEKPKQLKEFTGSKHAQHLFNSNHAKEIENLIINFLTKD